MKTSANHSPWLTIGNLNRKARLRLFCFTYAGGGASSFSQWQTHMHEDIQVCAVQLPGRENRITEPLFAKLSTLVNAMSDALSSCLDSPFAFFGHSLGAKIAFELARELRRNHGIQPLHLIVSGSRPPHIPEQRPLHNLPTPEFIEGLRRYAATPEAVLKNKDLMEMFLPILRADFSIDETYTYFEEPPLDCPISVFGGNEDKEATQEELDAWQQHTNKLSTFQMFRGDHFFIQNSQSLVLDSISRILLQYL